MKKLALLAPAMMIMTAPASAGVVDLSGAIANGTAPTLINHAEVDSGALTTISWDLSYTAITPSWGSEVEIVLFHFGSGFTYVLDGSDSNFADTNPADTTFGWADTPGDFEHAGSVDVSASGPADMSGSWLITISEEFDDLGTDPDGFFAPGSFIEISTVPAPGALLLLGLAGLISRTRRR